MKLTRNITCFVLTVFVFLSFSNSVFAQAKSLPELQAELVSLWLVTVEGVNRTRTMTIKEISQKSDGIFALNATFGLSDGKQTTIEAEINQTTQGHRLELTTSTGAKIIATQTPNGTFAGTFTPKGGETKGVTITKISENELQSMLDSTAKTTSSIETPAANVPAPCAAFSGKWKGTWSQGGIGQQWLWVASVDANCVAKVGYVGSTRTPKSFESVEIKGGELKWLCNKSTSGTCVLTRHGDDLWANYSNPSGGTNSAVFEKVQ